MTKREKSFPRLVELNKLIERRIGLAWWILEQKLMYYHPEYGKCVDDVIYDKYEQEYIELSKQLKRRPTASESVGFPFDRPSGRLVLDKLTAIRDGAKGFKLFEV